MSKVNFNQLKQTVTNLKNYTDKKFKIENIIFEGLENDELVISDVYTGLKDGFAYVIDKEIELSNNPDLFNYYITIGSSETENLFTFTPDMFKYQDSSQSYMASVDNAQFNGSIDICNKYNDQTNKIVITYDYITDCSTGSIGFKYMKIFTSNELINIVNNKLDKTSLNGGTTGQILSKKSNTDNDVEWINPQIKIINPTSTEEFFNMTTESGLYYIPVTNTIMIESNPTSTTERLVSGIEVNELISVYKTTEWGFNGELTNASDKGNYYYLYNTNTLFLYSQENGISYINRLNDTITEMEQSIGDNLYYLYNEIDFKSSISNIKARLLDNASIVIFNDIFCNNVTYYTDPNYSDENNKIQGKYVININKTLDGIGINDKLSVVLQYQLNGGYDIYKFNTTVANTTGVICSKLISLSNNKVAVRIHADSKINSDFSIENNVNYCAIEIIFASNMSVDIIKEIKDSLKMYVELSSLNILTLNNKEEYNPTDDYNPSTKKYVDDKIAGLVNSAPETLDTLNELASALGNDANFANTVTNSLANKSDKDHTHSQYLTEHQSLNGYATEEYVNNKLANLSIQTLTQTEYDALATKNSNVLYLITE